MIDLTELMAIEDFSNDTLIQLADRLEQSKTFHELLVREAELDEIYRRVETAMIEARDRGEDKGFQAGLERIYQLVWQAHDLAAEGEPLEAAKRLRDAMTGGST